jgi:hypothetical protein
MLVILKALINFSLPYFLIMLILFSIYVFDLMIQSSFLDFFSAKKHLSNLNLSSHANASQASSKAEGKNYTDNYQLQVQINCRL